MGRGSGWDDPGRVGRNRPTVSGPPPLVDHPRLPDLAHRGTRPRRPLQCGDRSGRRPSAHRPDEPEESLTGRVRMRTRPRPLRVPSPCCVTLPSSNRNSPKVTGSTEGRSEWAEDPFPGTSEGVRDVSPGGRWVGPLFRVALGNRAGVGWVLGCRVRTRDHPRPGRRGGCRRSRPRRRWGWSGPVSRTPADQPVPRSWDWCSGPWADPNHLSTKIVSVVPRSPVCPLEGGREGGTPKGRGWFCRGSWTPCRSDSREGFAFFRSDRKSFTHL